MLNHFTIVIPAYNVEKWAKKNICSALKQRYNNFDIIYINDASTDNTKKILDETQEELKNDTKENITIIHNKENKKALHNIVEAVSMAKEESIIVTIDGDDWLPHDNVLSKINKIYSEQEIWMTAGSYIDNLTGLVYSPNLDENYWKSNIRKKLWTISHLRTFKKKLFMKINHKDMIDEDEQFYKYTFDQAMMFPMAEMSGEKHFKDINDVVYVYNRNNPLSVDKIYRQQQLRIESIIRNKKPYKTLETLEQ